MQDVQYGDIDYMDSYMDFTLDEVNFGGLPEYVQYLKAEGTKCVLPVILIIYKTLSFQSFNKNFNKWYEFCP